MAAVKLDFSGLFDSEDSQTVNTKKEAQNVSKVEEKNIFRNNILENKEAHLRSENRPLKKEMPENDVGKVALAKLTRHQEDQQRAIQVYKQYQENIAKAQKNKADILKGIENNEPVEALLMRAIAAIERLTNDKTYFTTCQRGLINNYGVAFNNSYLLSVELFNVQERLDNLREAALKPHDEGEQQRLETAIREHEARVKELDQKVLKAIELEDQQQK